MRIPNAVVFILTTIFFLGSLIGWSLENLAERAPPGKISQKKNAKALKSE
jgi:hypothetical protein